MSSFTIIVKISVHFNLLYVIKDGQPMAPEFQ